MDVGSVAETPQGAGNTNLQMDDVDWLRLENAQLKLMLLRSKLQDLQETVSRSAEEYQALVLSLAKKYGFDPHTHHMEPKGIVVPNRPSSE